jgi:hypothetical protein
MQYFQQAQVFLQQADWGLPNFQLQRLQQRVAIAAQSVVQLSIGPSRFQSATSLNMLQRTSSELLLATANFAIDVKVAAAAK